jgi:hypothetical protein
MPDDLVTITTYSTAQAAETAKWALEQEGIPAFVADANVVAMDWLLGNAIGNVKLQVAETRADEAGAFLHAHPSFLDQPAAASPTDDNQCLSCGQAMPEDAEQCPACGWTFAPPDAETNEAAG